MNSTLRKTFIAILLFAPLFTVAQITPNKKVEIENAILLNKIQDYQAYIRKFTIDHHIKRYVIVLKCDSYRDYNTFTLSTILNESGILGCNPGRYAVVNNLPILIHDSFDAFVTKDPQFIKAFTAKYWSKEESATGNTGSQVNTTADSIVIKGKKYAATTINTSIESVTMPKSCVLVFQAGTCLSETMDKYELKTQ